MQPLTLDDLLPLDEYAGQRTELFASLCRYLDRYRRIRLGPRLTLRFENRQTLWFHVHELLRVARLTEPALVQHELDLYNRLLPGRDQLQAALVLDTTGVEAPREELAFWQSLQGDDLRLRLGGHSFPSRLVTCRPEDRCFGTAHWVQLTLDSGARRLLADSRQPAAFEVTHASYRHESPPLSDDVRQSLLEDLELSDRDTERAA